MSSLICSRNLAKKPGDGFHRMVPSGGRLVAIWESQTKNAVTHCHFRRSVIRRVSSIVVRIAGA
ncbi:MAG TPA: hypothetical protein VGQ43_08230, partial [Candidatus Udaeobacter sp.]|nr:hypothetical protein [Candidatus Udaeobacter sp.]